MDILKKVPHRHFVFSIPKILRRYFLFKRSLLHDLSCCAWESLKIFLQNAVPESNPIPGAARAIQTFGDFLGFNPQSHILVTDSCFYGNNGTMRISSSIEDGEIMKAILKHLGIWLVRSKPVPFSIRKPSPNAHSPPVCVHGTGRPSVEYVMDDHSPIPLNDDHLYYDPEYPRDAYIHA